MQKQLWFVLLNLKWKNQKVVWREEACVSSHIVQMD